MGAQWAAFAHRNRAFERRLEDPARAQAALLHDLIRRLARTEYGERFPSAIGHDACLAVQFHPEKSQRAGLALLERFCLWSP